MWKKLVLIGLVSHAAAAADLPAFPGAEGYGRHSQGGRGGDVYRVTSLDDSGPGTLRDAILSKRPDMPRTIVFGISGTIALQKELRLSGVKNLTIAGQTAPGEGITLRNHVVSFHNCSHLIVRFLRLRLGDESRTSDDVITLGSSKGECHDIIFDHLTATWGVDGIMDVYATRNFTLQWSLFGEALNDSTHHKREPHAMLMSFRNITGKVSIHHNLLFSSRDRHPTLGGGDPKLSSKDALFDFRNNVIYNWEGGCNLATGRFNLIGNYWRPGPNTRREEPPIGTKAMENNVTTGFFSGNVFVGNDGWNADNYAAFAWGIRGGKYTGEVTREQFIQAQDLVDAAERPVTHHAEEAYELVLSAAGASRPRDAADLRIVAGIRAGSHRRIDSQREVGGWPDLPVADGPVDQDRDGMPDAWEVQHGLDPMNPADGPLTSLSPGGYTNLEIYLNSLVHEPGRMR